jgi:hypothetical protein
MPAINETVSIRNTTAEDKDTIRPADTLRIIDGSSDEAAAIMRDVLAGMERKRARRDSAEERRHKRAAAREELRRMYGTGRWGTCYW